MGLFGLHLPKKVDNVFGDIGRVAQGVARDVNVFDNGASHSNPNPVNNQVGPVVNHPAAYDVGAYTEQYRPPSTINQIGNFAGGVGRQLNFLDNNATFKQQTPITNQSVSQQALGYGRGFVRPFNQLLVEPTVAAARQIPAELTGNRVAEYNANKNLFGGAQNARQALGNVAGNTAVVGLTLAAPGISSFAGDVVGSVLPSAASKGAINALRLAGTAGDTAAGGLLTNTALRTPLAASLTARVAAGALANQAINTGFGVSGQITSGEKINVGQAAKQAIPMTAIGVGSELAPHAIAHVRANPLNEVGAVGKNVKVTSDELAMGKALGMTAEDVKKAKSAPLETTPVPVKNTQKALVAEAQKQASQNPQLGKVGVPEATNGAQAHLNADYVANHEKRIGAAAQTELSKLSPADQELMKSIQTKGVQGALSKAENPQQFQAAADAIRNYYDLRHAYDHYLGIDTPYRQNYLRDLIDRNQVPDQQFTATGGNKAPGYTQAKTKPGVTNVAEALQRDIAGASFNHGKLTYAQGLEQAHPGQISRGSPLVGAEGVNKQLLTPYGQELFATKDLAKDINRRAVSEKPTGVLNAYDKVNANLKYYKLGGGTFHGVTEAGNIAGQQLLSGGLAKHPLQNLKGVAGIFSNKVHESNMKGYTERGIVDRARLSGVTLGENQILGDIKPAKIATKFPVIHQIHEAIFKRQIPEAKLMMFEQQTKGLDPMKPADLSKMRDVAKAVNNMGGINRAVDGLTPNTARKVSRVVLATDFTEGRWRTIGKALELNKWTPENKIARQMVVGKTIVFLLPTLAAATAAGKIDWNNPEDVAKNIADQILDPHFPTPFKGKTGIARVAKTPETFISEIGRMLKPVFDGNPDKTAGVKHYFGARLAAAPSLGEQVLTNQDYFGNPIVAQNPNGKINVGKTAANIGINSAPIPVSQGIKVAQGKQSAGEAAVNTLGARVVADPNSPQMKAFAFQDNTLKGLTPEDKAKWDVVYGSNKDKYGNPITVTPALDSQNNAYTLLTNPKLIETGKKVNDYKASQGLPSDPFFNLNSDQQKAVLNLAIDKFRNPSERTLLKDRNKSWLDQYNNDRTNYFSSLNLPPSTKTKELPEPQPPSNANDYFSLTDPTQKRDYLANHPEITDYFTAHDNFIREGRAKQGLPQYDKYPTAPPQIEKLMTTYSSLPKNDGPNGKSTTRSNWIKSHPNEWAAMTNQFSKQAQYGLEKDAAQAAYEGQDFSASGIKDIMSLAKDLGVSGGSSGYGGGTANYASKYDPSQYLNHAKTAAPPKLFKGVTVRKVAAKGRNYASSGKIKVSSRKAAA